MAEKKSVRVDQSQRLKRGKKKTIKITMEFSNGSKMAAEVGRKAFFRNESVQTL